MPRILIADLQEEIGCLKHEIECLSKDKNDQYDRLTRDRSDCNEKLRATRENNILLSKLAQDERKECLFLRKRMKEINESLIKLRSRIGFAIDCVGGRPSGEYVPMGPKLTIRVGAILSRAVDIPTSESVNLSDIDNMESHKLIRTESKLIDISKLDYLYTDKLEGREGIRM